MPTKIHKTIKMKLFPKGQVVIPVELRKKYHLEIGDHINVVSTDQGILLKPSSQKQDNTSLTDQLFGIFKNNAETKPSITKKDVQETTESNFSKAWSR
jgi:AbrB family looped-hinge helix DNA binding protein